MLTRIKQFAGRGLSYRQFPCCDYQLTRSTGRSVEGPRARWHYEVRVALFAIHERDAHDMRLGYTQPGNARRTFRQNPLCSWNPRGATGYP
jgi:hypothetical protein